MNKFSTSLLRALAGSALLVPALALAQVSQIPGPTSTGGSPSCVPGSLSSYEGLGTSGCTIGIATFYSFADNGAPSSSIGLTPVSIPLGNGLFNGFVFGQTGNTNPFANGATATSYTFDYYVDPPIDILGMGLADAPFPPGTSVTQTACAGFLIAGCPAGDLYTQTISNTTQNVFVPFAAPTQFLHVRTTVNLGPATSAEGFAPLTSFSEVYQVQRASTVVPEPHELALTGIGGLALLGALRARRRTKRTAA